MLTQEVLQEEQTTTHICVVGAVLTDLCIKSLFFQDNAPAGTIFGEDIDDVVEDLFESQSDGGKVTQLFGSSLIDTLVEYVCNIVIQCRVILNCP